MTYDDVAAFSLPLADIVALNTSIGVNSLFESVFRVIIPPSVSTPQTGIVLREVFRAKVESFRDRGWRWKELLQEFQDKNKFLRLVIDPEHNEDESEYNGWRVATYRFIDYSDQPYFVLHYRKEWTTYDDNWIDFSEPREIIVLAFLPAMQELVELVIDEASSMGAEQ